MAKSEKKKNRKNAKIKKIKYCIDKNSETFRYIVKVKSDNSDN